MVVSRTSDHTKIKIKIINPSQEHPASSNAPNQDLKDMDVLSTFKIKIESQKKTSDHIQIKIKIPTQVKNLQCPPKLQIRTLKTWMFFAPSKSR